MMRMTLMPLHKVASATRAEPLDLRGWTVIARDGCALGTVADVIVDVDDAAPVYLGIVPTGRDDTPPTECWIRVRYSDVEVDAGERHVEMSDIALLGLGTASMALVSDPLR
jgi:sporulation protein YlmC with PRC-barrel domain